MATKNSTPVITSGITSCVTPPPRLPQPAVVALAVPTTLGANITEVWYCVITNEAPITPISRRKMTNVSKFWESPISITGNEPRISNPVYVRRGPIRSSTQPIATRAKIVMKTEAISEVKTWELVRLRSSRTSPSSGAIPNQPKKQRKNASQVRWNVRM